MNGFICQGFNPLAAAPNKAKMNASARQAQVPRHHGSARHRDVASSGATSASTTTSIPKQIQTEVFRLPTSCFAEEDGALTNSSRWLQWHWKGADPPGEARSDLEIMAGIFTRMRAALSGRGRRAIPTRS